MDSNNTNRNDEVDLTEYLSPLIAGWKFILLLTLLGGLVTFFYMRSLPRVYRSSAVIYVQQAGGAVSLLRDLASPGSSGNMEGYIIALLSSETMFKAVNNSLKLGENQHFTQGRNMGENDVIERLSDAVDVSKTKVGSVRVTVETYNPDLAAKIANTMLHHLQKMVVTASKRKADFISARLEDNTIALKEAEKELKEFLEDNNLAFVEEQSKAVVAQLDELDKKLISLDVELESLNSQLANLGNLESLVSLEVQKKSLESSRDYVLQQRQRLENVLADIPRKANEYAQIQRKIAVLSKTYELFMEQYQLATITQKGEDGDYRVVDWARPNPIKVAPRVLASAIFGAMGSFLVACLFVLAAHKNKGIRQGR